MNLSVVINTLERPLTLKRCLDALKLQSDKAFEIIVIDQSRTKLTEELCNNYPLDYHKSAVFNLSHSRNLGIKFAKSELIAYVDDDAEPDREWVERIKAQFAADPSLAILAGKVINNTNPEQPVTQFQNGIVSLYGYTEDIHPVAETEYLKGKGLWYARPMGTNMAFRKSDLIRVKGFDEFYEYNHDETDVTVRMLKQGSKIKYDDALVVLHYPAQGLNRKNKYEINWFVDTKNNVYFGLKNGPDFYPIRLLRALKRILGSKGAFGIILKYLFSKQITLGKFVQFKLAALRGLIAGIWAGTFQKRKLLN